MIVTFCNLLSYKQRAKSTGCPAQLGYEEATKFPAFRHMLHGAQCVQGQSGQSNKVGPLSHPTSGDTLYTLTRVPTKRHLGLYLCVGVRIAVLLALHGERALPE